LPACSLDIRNPGQAEQALLRRVADELGAGRPPNRHRTPEDVALALIEAAKAARSTAGTVAAHDLAPRLDLVVDFGAVHEGHPVDGTVAITRSPLLGTVVGAIEERALAGGTLVLDGGAGAGKSWLCEQLADRLQDMGWLVARHHCWLGATDVRRDERVLSDVVIGSLLRQLATVAPAAVADLRPRFAATRQTLAAAVAAAQRTAAAQPILLIVDGLDHITRVLGRTDGSAVHTPQDPARVLVDELVQLDLPPGVVLLLASQPGDHLAAVVGEPLTVPPLTRREVRDLAQRLGLLAAFGADADRAGPAARSGTAVDLVHARSRGNALYATYLCRQAVGPVAGLDDDTTVASAVDALDRLRQVPDTADDLDGYYRYLVDGLTDGQRAAVTLLAVCDFAVAPGELREIFPLFALLIPSALTTVAPTIVQQPGVGGLRIHHESFSRFVRAQADAAGVAEIRAAAVAWLGSGASSSMPARFGTSLSCSSPSTATQTCPRWSGPTSWPRRSPDFNHSRPSPTCSTSPHAAAPIVTTGPHLSAASNSDEPPALTRTRGSPAPLRSTPTFSSRFSAPMPWPRACFTTACRPPRGGGGCCCALLSTPPAPPPRGTATWAPTRMRGTSEALTGTTTCTLWSSAAGCDCAGLARTKR
jgi:hypothetical protein